MGGPLSIGVIFSTNLTDDQKELESLKKELQNMQVTANIVCTRLLNASKTNRQKGIGILIQVDIFPPLSISFSSL